MKRYLPFLIILVVALITAGAATLFYRSKMGAPPVPATPANASASALAPPSPLALQPDDELAHAQGPANAPVTLEIYGDFQCPSCAIATANLDEVAKNYGDKLRMVFHEFPLAMHAHAVEAAMAAEAAGAQGKFWPMHDMLYRYQGVWSKSMSPGRFFVAYAQSLGMNPEQFQRDQESDEMKSRIMTQGDAGVKRGVKNTPTIFINGVEMRGEFSKESFKSAIDAALAAKGKS
jgi:protein-disulfide isomerase